jgi:hypothetical protein
MSNTIRGFERKQDIKKFRSLSKKLRALKKTDKTVNRTVKNEILKQVIIKNVP